MSQDRLAADVAGCFREHGDLIKENDRLRKLIWGAVHNCRSPDYRKGQKHPRWVAVMHSLGIGSTTAHELCRDYGTNPDDMVAR